MADITKATQRPGTPDHYDQFAIAKSQGKVLHTWRDSQGNSHQDDLGLPGGHKALSVAHTYVLGGTVCDVEALCDDDYTYAANFTISSGAWSSGWQKIGQSESTPPGF